jgi:hypothetical protein
LIAYGSLGAGFRQLFAGHAINGATTRIGRLTLTGVELAPGAGLQYFFNDHVALDGNAELGIGQFVYGVGFGTSGRFHGAGGVLAPRLRFGIAWFPTNE